MSWIRNRDTGPEIVAGSLLHGLGYRLIVNGAKNHALSGRSDIVLPKYRTAILVHGCFWHRHEGCKEAADEVLAGKFDLNVARDARDQALLKTVRWKVIVVWECQTKRPAALRKTSNRFNCQLTAA